MIVVILASLKGLMSDLTELKQAGNDLVLIADQIAFDSLSDSNKKELSNIYCLDKFNESNLSNIIADYVKKYGKDQVRIITNVETCVVHAAKLREKFSIPDGNIEQAEKFINKVIMKQALAPFNIRMPKYVAFDRDTYKEDKNKYLNTDYHRI